MADKTPDEFDEFDFETPEDAPADLDALFDSEDATGGLEATPRAADDPKPADAPRGAERAADAAAAEPEAPADDAAEDLDDVFAYLDEPEALEPSELLSAGARPADAPADEFGAFAALEGQADDDVEDVAEPNLETDRYEAGAEAEPFGAEFEEPARSEEDELAEAGAAVKGAVFGGPQPTFGSEDEGDLGEAPQFGGGFGFDDDGFGAGGSAAAAAPSRGAPRVSIALLALIGFGAVGWFVMTLLGVTGEAPTQVAAVPPPSAQAAAPAVPAPPVAAEPAPPESAAAAPAEPVADEPAMPELAHAPDAQPAAPEPAVAAVATETEAAPVPAVQPAPAVPAAETEPAAEAAPAEPAAAPAPVAEAVPAEAGADAEPAVEAAPAAVEPERVEVAALRPDAIKAGLKIQAIRYRPGASRAIVNFEAVEEGDTVAGARVVRILRDRVIFEVAGEQFTRRF